MRLIGCAGLFLAWNLAAAQTGPGGVGNSTNNVLWLSADNGVFSNAGTTPAVNTNDVGQWNDRSGNGRNASHAVVGERPNYLTNIVNGLPVIQFTSANGDRLLSTGVTSGNAATVFAVAAWSTLPHPNPGIIQASPAASPFGSNGQDKTIGMWVSSAAGNQLWGRGVQSNATQRDISQTTNTAVNTFYSFLNIYNDVTGSINQYVNNAAAGNVTYNNTLQSWSSFGIGRQANEGWNGNIAEVIAYNVAINSAQQIIVSNYLSAKYTLPLATNNVYTMDDAGNGNYDFEVAGIGQVNGTNLHNDAKGSGIVRVSAPTDLENNEFFMWGHDNGALQATNATDIPGGVTARFARTWRVSETGGDGNVGSIDLDFDVTGLPDFTSLTTCAASVALRLLVDTDNDGTFADETPIGNAIDMGGNVYKFAGVSAINNNMRFTLAIVNASGVEGPGGVGSGSPSNLRMWWRADAGITATGTSINTWADQSGNGNNLTAAGASRPVTATNAALNNRPVVRYGGAHYFSSAFTGPNTNNLTLFLVANGTSYQSLFRFQNTSGDFVVYPWEFGGAARTFISSSDGGTAGGVASNLATSVNNVGAARYRRNTTNGMQTFRNGGAPTQRNSVDAILPTEPFFSGIYNPTPGEYPNCDVGEMIGFNTALNDAQMIIVQNYLAAKYNVALTSNDVYTGDNPANGNFDFDVAGIGRVNSTNLHSDARGTGRVRIFNPTNLGDNEFLMWGHDNGSMTINTGNVFAPVAGRFTRVWRVSEVNAAGTAQDVGSVDVQVDLSFVTSSITAAHLAIIIDHNDNGSFSDAGTLVVTGATELSCHNFLFSGVTQLVNGRRFTFGTTNITQTPLPITLESFTGKITEGDARLSWTTVSETNNDYFTIERSMNGKDFLPVGEVDGGGTTQTRQQYGFTDPFVPYGKLYYRLKQTDLDLTHSYSGVIMLENKPQSLALIAVPNPSEQGQPVKLRVTRPEPMDFNNAVFSVFDMKGRAVPVQATPDESGQVLLNFTGAQASGVYLIMLRSPELPQVMVVRVVVL